MDDTNWTDAYGIIEIVEAELDFGPGGASIRHLEQTTDIETLIQNPFDFLQVLPNTIYIRNDSIRINYEVDSSIGEKLCDDQNLVNWSQDYKDILGFDILDLKLSITSRISGELAIYGGYWRINGPDDASCFDVRDYFLLVFEISMRKDK